METLTRENFWNEMSQKYPKAMKLFLDWVDDYKRSNNWNKLFNAGLDYVETYRAMPSKELVQNERSTKAPKFHELPIAMQWGIFLEWSFPYMWTESIERKEPGFMPSVERGIHHILRWKEHRLKENATAIDRIEPV